MWKDYFVSIWLFAKGIASDIYARIGFLLSLLEIVKLLISNNKMHDYLNLVPAKFSWPIVISLFVLSLFRVFHQLRMEKKSLEKLDSDLSMALTII